MRVRTFQTVIFALVLLPIAGCTDAKRTERAQWLQSQIAASEARIAELSPIVKALEEQWVELRTKLADPNNTKDAQVIGAKMKQVETELTRAKPALVAAQDAVATMKPELDRILADGNVTAGEEMQAVGSGVSAVGTAVGGPWGAVIAAAGMVITGIGTAVVRGKMAQSELEAERLRARDEQDEVIESWRAELGSQQEAVRQARTAITGIVNSTSALLDSPLVTDKEAAKSILARAQVKTPEAAAAVRKVLDAQKVS